MLKKLKEEKYIMHVDGDSFFVGCEVARRPDLKGRPVVVGEERGIVTAMSKEAKALGIDRATPVYKIRKEMPQVMVLQSHFELYEKFCANLYNILSEYSDEVEVYSIDECFLNFTYYDVLKYFNMQSSIEGNSIESEELYDRQEEYLKIENHNVLELIEKYVREIKNRVQNDLGITYSFGVGATKVIAKLASTHNKPNGLCVMLSEKYVQEVYETKKTAAVWGIGRKTTEKLMNRKIYTVHEFVNIPENDVIRYFDKPLINIWLELKGIKKLTINSDHEDLQSMQATRSFADHTNSKSFLFSELSKNIESACTRMICNDLYSNYLSIFIKVHIKGQKWGKYFSTSIQLKHYTRDVKYILNECYRAFDSILDQNYIYKSTGVHFFNLKRRDDIQLDMFGGQMCKYEEEKYLEVYSSIKSKYGSSKIMMASSLSSSQRRDRVQEIRDSKDNYIYGLPLPYMGEVN